MLFKRILIAVDNSEIGEHATLVGLGLASVIRAQIAFIHVIAPGISDGACYAVASPELVDPPEDEISQVLAGIRACAPIPVDSVKFVPVGDPVGCITAPAGDWPADLVVIGSHGRDSIDRVLLGSVAEGVARHSPCPVLIVGRPARALRALSGHGLGRVEAF